MEKIILVGSAVLLVAYFILTETLDWIGRIEVICDHLPRSTALLGSRPFRTALLLVAVGLLIRVATEGRGAAGVVTQSAPSASQPAPTQHSQPAAEQSSPATSPSTIAPSGGKRRKSPTPPQGRAAPSVSASENNSPAVGSITQGSGSALSINQQGGITAGTINNNYTPQPRIPQYNVDKLSRQLSLCSSGPTTVIPSVVNPSGSTEQDAQNLVAAFARTGKWNYSGVGRTIKGQDIGQDGPIPDPVGIHISSDASHQSLANCVKAALHSIGVESMVETKQDQGDSLSIVVGNNPH
jgi:hypothetical protein